MSNGSKEQELPPLDEAEIKAAFKTFNYKYFGDYELSEEQREAVIVCWTAAERLLVVEPDLRAQIATLAKQVERDTADTSWARTNRPKLADCEDALRKAEAELAALREGAKVTYWVEGLSSNQVWYTTESAKTPSEARLWIEQRKAMPFPYCEYRVAEVTVITCERILDADGGEG